ncbi:MAG: hypothetical protein JXB62_03715 [Pirellulales bacterium]|nr:hypothetical protein [Pirellulales bacterium]
MLLFYCRECEATFESEPDGTGCEQAPCPACGDICLTVQFEREEQERRRNEATLFSFIGRFTGLFSMISRLTGFFIHARDTSDGTLGAGQEGRADLPLMQDPVIVCTFATLGEANTCRALLEQCGIQSQLAQVPGTNPFLPHTADGVVVRVPSSDLERASSIMDEHRSIMNRRRTAHTQDARITFACEECAAEITFPTHRRGYAEICPCCRAYVDVPE